MSNAPQYERPSYFTKKRVDMIEFREPRQGLAPVLISVPHAGTEIPEEIQDSYLPERLGDLCDTDWFIHELYDFARDLGIGIVRTRLSRWVIDMNRDPQGIALYNDGRTITELVPTKTFVGMPLYPEARRPNPAEVERRKNLYFAPYHKLLNSKLEELEAKFERVLLLDAHSIIHHVPAIHRQAFPDLILGSNDENSADPDIIRAAVNILGRNEEGLSFSHNHPFKGGYITRHYGRFRPKLSALQLEMVQKNYMDEARRQISPGPAQMTQGLLKKLLNGLMEILRP